MEQLDLRGVLDARIPRVFRDRADEKADAKGTGVYFDQYLN